MGYSLGIDLGATTCAAAIRRGTDLEPCVLGEGTATMPSVVLLRADGSLVVGEAADHASRYEPTLVARMVSARLDQPGPIVVDGEPCDPLALTEALVGTVVDRVASAQGARPDHVVVTYPLRAGDDAELLLGEAAGRAIGPDATMVPAAVAAVAKLAHDRDLGPDSVIAVVDFGGSSVDVTLVRRTDTAFDLVGDPATLTEVGGADLDAIVLSLVESALGDITSSVGHDDHAGMRALRRVRASCRDAKERLSTEHTAVVEVALPHARGRVEITRDAFEQAAEPALTDAVDLLQAAIDDAGLIPADISQVLLTGGSANIPRLAEIVSERTGAAIVIDSAPELTVAQGAALFADLADGVPGTVTGAHSAVASPLPPPALGDLVPPPAAPFLPPPDTGSIFGNLPGDPPPAPNPFADLAGPATGEHSIFGALPGDPPPAPAAPADPFADLAGPPTGERTVFGDRPAPATGGHDWTDDLWPDEPAGSDGSDGDTRTSVFDPQPAATAWASAATPHGDGAAGDAGQDEFQRLRTSDTDPFGTRSGALAAARRRERDGEWYDEEEDTGDDGTLDVRLVLGGVAVALVIVLVAGFALLSGGGGDDSPSIAVADTANTTASSTTTVATTTTLATTTSESTTTTEEPTTTTTRPRPQPTTTVPPTTAPPFTAPPPTAPPPAPTTTTTRPAPTTSTTAPTTSTTACPTPDEPDSCDSP